MKKHSLIGIIFFCLFLLVGCATSKTPFSQSQVNRNLLNETWLKRMNLDPNVWTRGSDRWFLTGEPNFTERYVETAPVSEALTTMNVRVSDFTNIQVDSQVQVQIIGQQEHNSVYLLGPNNQIRQTAVEIYNHTLYIRSAKDADLRKVIVRIGVRNLRQITNRGYGNIYGRDITSDNLCINSLNGGKIVLAGDMNVSKINQAGTGTVTVIGAYTPALNIRVTGNGNVNVSGRVGVRSIQNLGNCSVNIIGADTDALTIWAARNGVTSVAGYANLKKVTACDNSQVYLYWVNSNGTYVFESGNARVGLAGMTKSLNVDITGNSQFLGQFLHGQNVYVRTRDNSHANVTADEKLFAAAYDHSTIYFFGSPNIVSRFTAGYGVVIPVWNEGTSLPMSTLPPPPCRTPQPMQQRMFKGEFPAAQPVPVVATPYYSNEAQKARVRSFVSKYNSPPPKKKVKK
jgi:hypothetical protein